MSAVREDEVEIFCSYAHEDEPLRQEFDTSVALMRRNRQIQLWFDRQIQAGDHWKDSIDEHLDSADLIALFVSRDFLASDYCYEKELKRALEREAAKEAVVVPIIVRECDWSDAPFRYLQGIPSGKAVTSWPNRDEAWTAVAKALKLIVLDILKRKQAKLQATAPVTIPRLPVPPVTPLVAPMDPEAIRADQERAQAIYAQIMRDAAKQRSERARIAADLQARIWSLELDLAVNKRKTQSDITDRMDAYIKAPDE